MKRVYAIFKLSDKCQKFGDIYSRPELGKLIHWDFNGKTFEVTEPGKYFVVWFNDPGILVDHPNPDVANIIFDKMNVGARDMEFECYEIPTPMNLTAD